MSYHFLIFLLLLEPVPRFWETYEPTSQAPGKTAPIRLPFFTHVGDGPHLSVASARHSFPSPLDCFAFLSIRLQRGCHRGIHFIKIIMPGAGTGEPSEKAGVQGFPNAGRKTGLLFNPSSTHALLDFRPPGGLMLVILFYYYSLFLPCE